MRDARRSFDSAVVTAEFVWHGSRLVQQLDYQIWLLEDYKNEKLFCHHVFLEINHWGRYGPF